MLPLALRRAAVVVGSVAALAGCGGQGSATQCGIDGCTVTFQRDAAAAVSILGVEARLVGVDAGNAQLVVAGQTLTVPVGGEAVAEGFTVGVEQVTDTEVVVRISA